MTTPRAEDPRRQPLLLVRPTPMRLLVAVLLAVAPGLSGLASPQSAVPPTRSHHPDVAAQSPASLGAASYAKILCSAVFVSGRDVDVNHVPPEPRLLGSATWLRWGCGSVRTWCWRADDGTCEAPCGRPWVRMRSPRTSKLLCEQQGGRHAPHRRTRRGGRWGSAPSQGIRGHRSWMDPSLRKHRPL